ncbi:hypothetical protein BA950_14215 [Erythrobacter sp. SAORIC-644]|nr:hypothetical protein BA950_14215 [Erythrobacter sp. SAORIC-644]
MRPTARYLSWALGSATYWAVALFLVLFMSWAIGGDCGLEQTEAGLKACAQEKRWVVTGSLAVAATVYIIAVRAILGCRS